MYLLNCSKCVKFIHICVTALNGVSRKMRETANLCNLTIIELAYACMFAHLFLRDGLHLGRQTFKD